MAGRRLPNSSSSERIASSPFSGRRWRSTSSHCGPPTAPKQDSVRSFAGLIQSLLRGQGYTHRIHEPRRPSGRSRALCRGRTYSSTRLQALVTASAIISGPILSPWQHQYVSFASNHYLIAPKYPRVLRRTLSLILPNRIGLLQCQTDLIQPV